ncbi:hypothetical protein [Bacillus sp. FJAT-22090]|uniref:hypothetical protein n=1 Tax=Bacillus sp. FJAT-22090 TaxID=1581038 RepID=UPI0011A925E8|nr:hypothetical protein [Bacillus sp. FJAT-22090]
MTISEMKRAKTVGKHEIYGELKHDQIGEHFYINLTNKTVTYAYPDVTSENFNFDLEIDKVQNDDAWAYDTYTFEEWERL